MGILNTIHYYLYFVNSTKIFPNECCYLNINKVLSLTFNFFLKACSSYFVFHICHKYVVNDKEKLVVSMISEKVSILWRISIFLQYIFISEKKDNFNLKERFFQVFLFYKVIGLSSATWWLFRVGENVLINTKEGR